jgi:glyoxylase-like metal-dependent hydrolase (beta-lactamase superfamily II)
MRRAIALTILIVAGAAITGLAAVQPAPTEKPKLIEVEKLKDILFVLRGGGGNSAVFVTETGVVVVDSKNPGWGQPLLDKIKELTPKPVTHLINTHTHFDHVSGNVEFPPSVEIVAHENTAALMKEMRPVTGSTANVGNIFADHNGRGLPKRTFGDRGTVGAGRDRVELRYFGRGHTRGDAWVVFPSLRMVHAGDIFSGQNLPLLDANNGGSGVEIGETLAKAAAGLASDVDTIITGHSRQMTVADLREYAEFNREFLATVRDAKKAGRSVDDIASAWKMPAKYAGYTEPQPARLKSNVEVVYAEIR